MGFICIRSPYFSFVWICLILSILCFGHLIMLGRCWFLCLVHNRIFDAWHSRFWFVTWSICLAITVNAWLTLTILISWIFTAGFGLGFDSFRDDHFKDTHFFIFILRWLFASTLLFLDLFTVTTSSSIAVCGHSLRVDLLVGASLLWHCAFGFHLC